MIVKSCSSDRQDDVSVIDRGDGFSEVWLRRNHAQDAADNGPEGPATTFWTCDEVSFVARGQASVAEVTARFACRVDPTDILIRQVDTSMPPHRYLHRGGSRRLP